MREYIPSEFDLHQRIDIPYSSEQYFYIDNLMGRMCELYAKESIGEKLHYAVVEHIFRREVEHLDRIERKIEEMERMVGLR